MSERDVMKFKAAIRSVALESGVPAQVVLQNFMFERFLARLEKSSCRQSWILKGGMLISHLLGLERRTTMDMDVTIKGMPLDEMHLRDVLMSVCNVEAHDTVTFELGSFSQIRDDDIYGGYRAKMTARMDSISVPLSIDFSTGDAITPEPREYYLKSYFGKNECYRVYGYTIETILAEKVQTILQRGLLNTRPRDFYDIVVLSENFNPNAEMFMSALRATCEHRKTPEVLYHPKSTLGSIVADPGMSAQCDKFRKQYRFASDMEFRVVCEKICRLLEP